MFSVWLLSIWWCNITPWRVLFTFRFILGQINYNEFFRWLSAGFFFRKVGGCLFTFSSFGTWKFMQYYAHGRVVIHLIFCFVYLLWLMLPIKPLLKKTKCWLARFGLTQKWNNFASQLGSRCSFVSVIQKQQQQHTVIYPNTSLSQWILTFWMNEFCFISIFFHLFAWFLSRISFQFICRWTNNKWTETILFLLVFVLMLLFCVLFSSEAAEREFYFVLWISGIFNLVCWNINLYIFYFN